MARRSKLSLGLSAACAAGVLGLSMMAQAQERPDVVRPLQLTLAEGYGGAVDLNGSENAGAGNEQPSTTKVTKDGRTYLVTVYMSSDVEEGFWQCKCSSVELTETGPVFVANNVQLTSNEGGYRPCNHPRIASDGENMVWIYGSDVFDPDNTANYAGQIDEMCNAPPAQMITDSPDNDVGAPDIEYVGKRDGVSYFLGAGHDNRGDDYAEIYGLTLTPNEAGTMDLSRNFREDVTTPANVARPVIAATPEEDGGPMRALVCSAKGNQRPPEDGVECSWVDPETGQVLVTELIAESKVEEKIYFNQPSVAALSNGRFAVMALESNGNGRKTGEKGSNKAHLYIVEPSDTSISFKDQDGDLPLAWQTHAGICAGEYGPDGQVHIAVMGASVTGIGQPKMQMVGWAPETGITTNAKDEWIVASYGDSGFMSNIYGANPGQSGRDFMECIGSVSNPGYRKEGGFMPTVKTLFVQPIAGKPATDPKNALFLSLIPGGSDEKLDGAGPGEGSGGGGSGGGDGATSGGNTNNADGQNVQADGCSCRVGGLPTEGEGRALALLGVGLMLAARRRGRA